MNGAKKERWSEEEVLLLPAGELDYFDRKSGAIVNDSDFQKKLAKALSAFANSGGGSLILGVRDDGKIDGVPKVYKGRASTREWLEQAIPNLLSYPLQDFRVHEVDPTTPTTIPSGNVVIVIDVGDSERAPHQDTFTKLYYHRVSGHSEPAPHLYLESLRLREKYPSREIVCAWRDYVLNPLLSTLVSERAYLGERKWTWEASRGRAHGLSIYYISERGSYTANQEQFLESHPEIQEAMDTHDEAAAEVLTRCEQLFQTIKESSRLLDTYVEAVSSASLQELKAKYPNDMRHGETDEAILRTLFGNPDDQEGHLAMFAADIMNKVGDISSTGRMSSPLWDTYREKFLEVLNYPPVSDHWARADSAREELLRRIESLIALLKTRRSDLTKRQGVPVEVTKEVQVIYREGLHYL
jgi:hypothetical protein